MSTDTNLDRVIDDLAEVAPTLARPGKVASPEGTRPGMEKYHNPDTGAPLSPDVDALFGATKSYHRYMKEKFEHRLMLWYKLQGYSNVEISRITGYTTQTISQVSKQVWFQEAFCKLSAEMGKDAIQTFLEGEVLPALERTAAMARTADSDAVKLAANREILDRFLGKSTVKVETKGIVDINHTVLDANKLLEEQRRLDEQLKANGLSLHGRS